MSNQPSVYISHAWGGESESIVQDIIKRCTQEGIPVIMDKNNLGYRQSITAFMQELGKADAIIIVVSNKYLHSEFCMYELLQIYENKNIMDRIFPIVLNEVNISRSSDRIDLVKYWEQQTTELETKMRELQTLGNLEGITDDLNLYHNIRSKIAKLTSILKDINTLNIQLHKQSDYDQLIQAIKKKFNEIPIPANNPVKDNPAPALSTYSKPAGTNYSKWIWPLALLVPISLVSWFILSDFTNKPPDNKITSEIDSSILKKDTTSALLSQQPMGKADTLQSTLMTRPPNDRTKPSTSQKNNKGAEIKNGQRVTALPSNPDIKKEKPDGIPENNKTQSELLLSNKPASKLIELPVSEQLLEGEIIEAISSNNAVPGSIIYLKNNTPIYAAGHLIIEQGAAIRAKVTVVQSSIANSRGALTLVIDAVQNINKEWMGLQYAELSDKKREEIIFNRGVKLKKLKLKPGTIKIKI